MENLERIEALRKILLELPANLGERDDAAMDLEAFDEPEAVQVLLKVGSNPNEDEMVLEKCGESLAGIWLRTGRFDPSGFSSLVGNARREARIFLSAKHPEWIKGL